MATYFSQPCPTCGRTLAIRVKFLGRDLQCQHCSGCFKAHDPADGSTPSDSGLDLLARADDLLHRAAAQEEWA